MEIGLKVCMPASGTAGYVNKHVLLCSDKLSGNGAEGIIIAVLLLDS